MTNQNEIVGKENSTGLAATALAFVVVSQLPYKLSKVLTAIYAIANYDPAIKIVKVLKSQRKLWVYEGKEGDKP